MTTRVTVQTFLPLLLACSSWHDCYHLSTPCFPNWAICKRRRTCCYWFDCDRRTKPRVQHQHHHYYRQRYAWPGRSVGHIFPQNPYLNVDVKHGVTVSVVVFTFFNSEKVFATQTLLFVNKTEFQWFFSIDVSLVGEFLTGLQIFGKRSKTNIIRVSFWIGFRGLKIFNFKCFVCMF